MKRISNISSRLKEYRDMYNLTLADMERKTGIPAQTINRYELGQRVPKIDIAVSIAEALKINPLWIQGYDVGMTDKSDSLNEMGWEKGPDSQTADDPFSFSNIQPVKKHRIPLLGEIACGEPIFADEDFEGFIESDIEADFALRCNGDSMTGARIMDGDIVLIKKQDMVENGQIAAVIIENEATLKRVMYFKEKNTLILKPENPRYEDLIYTNDELNQIRILGKAVAFYSKVR